MPPERGAAPTAAGDFLGSRRIQHKYLTPIEYCLRITAAKVTKIKPAYFEANTTG
jgi:hypothetical protein